MDGFETCRRLKSDPATGHIPIVMITALGQKEDRVRGLQAGADDFLTKPVDNLQLMTRVKSLVRLKSLTDELRLRAATTRNIGIEELLSRRDGESTRAKVLVLDQIEASGERMRGVLARECEADLMADVQAGFFRAADGAYDCVIISTAMDDHDPLRLCAQLRALDRTRFLPIMLAVNEGEDERVIRGLELGINDFLVRPVDEHELVARLRTQVRRKRYNDHLRRSVTETIEMAVIDPLTGLHNRRYLDSHLRTLFERANMRRRPLSLMIADIDRFKAINDRLGHDGGDAVLREFASRLRKNLRGIDLVCRFGGEEFVIVMPDTDGPVAERVAERVRAQIANAPFAIEGGAPINVTASLGVAALTRPADTVEALMKRADVALYEAKNGGRNRVAATAA
jgi:two-component system cell cycle response regulator